MKAREQASPVLQYLDLRMVSTPSKHTACYTTVTESGIRIQGCIIHAQMYFICHNVHKTQGLCSKYICKALGS